MQGVRSVEDSNIKVLDCSGMYYLNMFLSLTQLYVGSTAVC